MFPFHQLKHLKQINSVDWSAAARSALHLLPDYHFGQGQSHGLVNITLELTYRCQWRCDFCFLKDNYLNREMDELHLDEILRLADAVAPQKISFFLTGGEPFVRSDVFEIIAGIKARGLKVGVNTNHALLNADKIDALRDMGLDYLISSVHGPEEVHNQVTGARNFRKVMQNLEHWGSKPRKTRLLINYVITAANLPYLKDMVDIAAETGIDLLVFQHESYLLPHELEKHNAAWEAHFGEKNPLELSHLRLPGPWADVAALRAAIREMYAHAGERGVRAVVKPDLSDTEMDRWYNGRFHLKGRCSYLYTDMRINPMGQVVTCQPIPFPVGNIREMDPVALFNGEPYRAFRRAIKESGGLFPACARCCKLHRRF